MRSHVFIPQSGKLVDILDIPIDELKEDLESYTKDALVTIILALYDVMQSV